MQQVFISSIQRDYDDVRDAVRGVVDSLDMRPMMAELAGSRPRAPFSTSSAAATSSCS